jgi:ABC-2 type transport system ATP-binding protein
MSSQEQGAALLSVRSLHKKYRKLTVIEDLSFEVRAGEFVGLIGPNGAGKSTTMGCICGVVVPTSGQVLIEGQDVLADPIAARRLISFVPQDVALYDHLTGDEYLRFVAAVRHMTEGEASEQIERLLAMTELTKARNRLVKEYSGGMARKIAICAAMLGPPKLLILDESFVGLDPESTASLRVALLDYCAQGHAVLLSSHILEMLERICTRVIMLVGGDLKLDEPIDELKRRFERGPDPDLTSLYLRLADKLPADART